MHELHVGDIIGQRRRSRRPRQNLTGRVATGREALVDDDPAAAGIYVKRPDIANEGFVEPLLHVFDLALTTPFHATDRLGQRPGLERGRIKPVDPRAFEQLKQFPSRACISIGEPMRMGCNGLRGTGFRSCGRGSGERRLCGNQ